MEDEESLESCALVSQFSDPVKDQIDNLLANGVVAPCIIIGSILLPSDELLRMEELAVSASADFINDSWL